MHNKLLKSINRAVNNTECQRVKLNAWLYSTQQLTSTICPNNKTPPTFSHPLLKLGMREIVLVPAEDVVRLALASS